MNNGNARINRNLTRYQATFLRRLPMSLEKLQHVKQGTVRWCYKRELFEIRKRVVERTALGDALLYEVAHAEIERSRSMFDAPFTSVLQQLADVARQEPERHLRVMRRSAA